MNAERLSVLARTLSDAWTGATTVPAPSRLEPSLTGNYPVIPAERVEFSAHFDALGTVDVRFLP